MESRVRYVGEDIVIETELKDARRRPVNVDGGMVVYIQLPLTRQIVGPFDMTREADGVYRYTYNPTVHGKHYYRIQSGSDTLRIIEESHFNIKKLPSATLSDFPAVVGVGTTPVITFEAQDGRRGGQVGTTPTITYTAFAAVPNTIGVADDIDYEEYAYLGVDATFSLDTPSVFMVSLDNEFVYYNYPSLTEVITDLVFPEDITNIDYHQTEKMIYGYAAGSGNVYKWGPRGDNFEFVFSTGYTDGVGISVDSYNDYILIAYHYIPAITAYVVDWFNMSGVFQFNRFTNTIAGLRFDHIYAYGFGSTVFAQAGYGGLGTHRLHKLPYVGSRTQNIEVYGTGGDCTVDEENSIVYLLDGPYVYSEVFSNPTSPTQAVNLAAIGSNPVPNYRSIDYFKSGSVRLLFATSGVSIAKDPQMIDLSDNSVTSIGTGHGKCICTVRPIRTS